MKFNILSYNWAALIGIFLGLTPIHSIITSDISIYDDRKYLIEVYQK